jgi:hypothetical protein
MKHFLATWALFFALMVAGLIVYRVATLKPVRTAISEEFGPSAQECSTIESRLVRIDCPTALMDSVLFRNLSITLRFDKPLKPQDLYWQEKVASADVLAELPHNSLLEYWRKRMFNRFDLRRLEHLGDADYRLEFRVVRITEGTRGTLRADRDRFKWTSDDTNPVSLLLERRGTLRFRPLGIPWQLHLLHTDDHLLISGSYRL